MYLSIRTYKKQTRSQNRIVNTHHPIITPPFIKKSAFQLLSFSKPACVPQKSLHYHTGRQENVFLMIYQLYKKLMIVVLFRYDEIRFIDFSRSDWFNTNQNKPIGHFTQVSFSHPWKIVENFTIRNETSIQKFEINFCFVKVKE